MHSPVECLMHFDCSLAESGKHLVCRVNVPITVELAYSIAHELNRLAAETGIENRLIDVRGLPNLMSVTTSYDLAYKGMETLEIHRSTKVAVLSNDDDASHEFVLIVMRNEVYIFCAL